MIGPQDGAKNASIIYKKGMKIPNYGGCSNPCSFLSINSLEHEKYLNRFNGYSLVYLSFEEIIKVNKSYYTYNSLSYLCLLKSVDILDCFLEYALFPNYTILNISIVVKYMFLEPKHFFKHE